MKQTYELKVDSSLSAVDWAQQLILRSLVFFRVTILGFKCFDVFSRKSSSEIPKSGIWGIIIMSWVMINGYLEKCLLFFSVGLYAVLDVAFQKEMQIKIWIWKQNSRSQDWAEKSLSKEISVLDIKISVTKTDFCFISVLLIANKRISWMQNYSEQTRRSHPSDCNKTYCGK